MGMLLIVSGFVNMLLMKSKQALGDKNMWWAGSIHLKLLTSTIIFYNYITKPYS